MSAVIRDTGLTHGGFYKHFTSKDDLLVESLSEAFREFTDTLVRAAQQSPSGEAWKAIVKTYLRPEMCEHPERGCPLAALAPELARVDKRMKPRIVTELVNYKSRMVPFMPGSTATHGAQERQIDNQLAERVDQGHVDRRETTDAANVSADVKAVPILCFYEGA